jgi:hypothetical protein
MAHLKMLGGGRESRPLSLPAGEATSQVQFLVFGIDGVKLMVERAAGCIAAFLRVRGNWVVMAPSGNGPLSVNGIPAPSLKILDHGDVLEVSGLRLQLSTFSEVVLPPESPLIQEGKACPVCLKHFAADDKVTFCPVCDLAHHADCFRFTEKCASNPFCGFIVPEEERENQREAGT